MLSQSHNNKKRRIDYNHSIIIPFKKKKKDDIKIEKKSNDISNKKLLKLLLKEIHQLRKEIKQIEHLKQMNEDKNAIILDLQRELELTRKDNQQANYYY